MSKTSQGHAVVIGGSIAGLMAARALSESFGRVSIVERDELPHGIEHRRGVPQAKQLHVLLPLGASIMEEFFPGLSRELMDRGCSVFDEVKDTPWFGRMGWRARRDSDVRLIGFRRPLLEHVVRERIRSISSIEIVHGTVSGLLSSDDRSRIVGVSVVGAERSWSIEADLVVDASGRGTQSPRWLEGLGYEPPGERHIRAHYGYASCFVRLDESRLPRGLRGVIAMPFPGQTRGGLMLPADNGLYTCCAMGAMKDYPPEDRAGFMAFLRDAATPLLAAMAEAAEPVTEINAYRHPGNLRRLWEHMPRRPARFVPIGDAVASANPIYGQGMTTASLEARKLRDRIASLSGDLDRLADAFMADLTAACEFPFSVASNSDANYPGTTFVNFDPPPQEQRDFMAEVERVATDDADVARDLLHATGWFDPTLLNSPQLQAKVAAWRAAGRTVTNTDPRTAPEPAV